MSLNMKFSVGDMVYTKHDFKVRGHIVEINEEENKCSIQIGDNISEFYINQLISNPHTVIDNLLYEIQELKDNYYDLKKSTIISK